MSQIKYYSYIANDIHIEFRYKEGLTSINEIRLDLTPEADEIELSYDTTFTKIIYRRIEKREGWTNKLVPFHIQLIPNADIYRIHVDIEKEI